MAILSVDRLSSGRTGNVNQVGVRNYTAVYRVITDNKEDGPQVVRQATGIPRVLDGYNNGNDVDAGARVVDVRADLQDEKSLTVWKVTVEYSSDSGQSGQQQEDPLDRPAVQRWSFNRYVKLVEKYLDDKKFSNTADEPFEPYEIDDSRPVLEVTRNQASFNPVLAYEYRDAVNSDAFFGAAPGTAKVASISASQSEENGILFWVVRYAIEFNPDGWQPKIRNQGLMMRNSTGDQVNATNDKGQPTTTAIDLAQDGTKLAAGAAAIYLDFRMYPKKPFSVFGNYTARGRE